MTRQELIDELECIIERARLSRETQPAASVLSTLQGAVLVGEDAALMELTAQFSRSLILAINARSN